MQLACSPKFRWPTLPFFIGRFHPPAGLRLARASFRSKRLRGALRQPPLLPHAACLRTGSRGGSSTFARKLRTDIRSCRTIVFLDRSRRLV
jgi:hypothetical protein